MKFSKLSEYFLKIESTASRNEMTAILADLLKEASKDEIDKVCYLSLGRLAPLYEGIEFNLAEKTMVKILAVAYGVDADKVKKLYKDKGDLGEAAEDLASGRSAGKTPGVSEGLTSGVKEVGDRRNSFAVSQVYNELRRIAEVSGAGSQEKKMRWMAGLLRKLDPLSVRYVVRIPLGKLRLGFLDKTILDGLSVMGAGDKSLRASLERAYSACPDIGEIAKRFKEKGLGGLSGIKVEVGRPILAMLCQRIPTAEEIIRKMGPVLAEPKLDGTRVQLHLDRKRAVGEGAQRVLEGFGSPKTFVRTFTRNLEDTTRMFPDIVKAALAQVRAESVILDGEAIGYDAKTGRFLPFQITMQRKRKYQVGEKAKEVPLRYVVFDILYKDGRVMLGKTLKERRKVLEGVVGEGTGIVLGTQRKISNPEELDAYRQEVIDRGLEGLVLKKPDSLYEAGGRGFSWVKFKREEGAVLEDTLDCVVLGYYFGKGKRAEFGISAFLVGVYDSKDSLFKTVSKIGTGLTDAQWREMKSRCDALRVKGQPKGTEVPKDLVPDVWVEPKMVVAIRSDEITKSPLHSAGYALRFPRLMAWRDDKSAGEATTVGEVETLFEQQTRDRV